MRGLLLLAMTLAGFLPALGQLTVQPAQVHLGRVTNAVPQRVVLTVRNTGLVPLRVLRIEAPCYVRVVRRPQGFIAPASRAVVELELPTDGRRGRWAFALTLHHTGWDLPLTVPIEAEVTASDQPPFRGSDTLGGVVFSARRITLRGLTRSAQPREVTLRALNVSSRPITLVDSLPGPFELVPSRLTLLPGQPIQLLLRYRPGVTIPTENRWGDSRWGGFELPVWLYSTDSLVPLKTLTLTGTFDPGGPNGFLSNGAQARAEFDRTEFSYTGAPRAVTARVRVSNPGSAPLRLSPLTYAGSGLSLAGDTLLAPRASGLITLSYSPTGPNPSAHRTALIETSDPQRPVVTLRLRFTGTR